LHELVGRVEHLGAMEKALLQNRLHGIVVLGLDRLFEIRLLFGKGL
jgi:hypothetical protein